MTHKVFYIFRHGETDYNKERRWQGCGIDSELNLTGEAQARALISKLQNKGLQIIYSSPLKRAMKTAEIVAGGLGIGIERIADLREGRFGEAEGMLRTEIAEKFADIFNNWYSDENNLDVGFPGGETKRQMQERMFAVIDSLLSAPQEIIGISSHSSSIRYLLMKFGYGPHRMENTALFKLEYDNGKWTLETL